MEIAMYASTLFFALLSLYVPSGDSRKSVQDPAAKQLYYDLMTRRGYNSVIRPSAGHLKKLTVKLGLRLSQVLAVDERNQILTISVWLRQEWDDTRLQWDPSEYGGVRVLNIPSEDLWKPDLVLYNNADGDFQITLKTKAIVNFAGKIIWEPPAIYKSYCPIDVEFFPFDIQECFLKFSSWTYHGNELDLQHVCTGNGSVVSNKASGELIIPRGIDLTDYYHNVEWDILNVTAMRKVKFYPCCSEPYPDITFNITLRRRTLFYTLNLIMPCVSISCLTVLVFYLPSDSGEKITLSISILLALTVFFLLLSDMNPPTSLVIPLIGKYLLFIMIVVTMSITLTVYTLHINFKSPTTHKMSPWVRRIFTEILPRVLFMRRPELQHSSSKMMLRTVNGIELRETPSPGREPAHTYENVRSTNEAAESDMTSNYYPPEVMEAIKGVTFIANHLKKGDEDVAEERDWKYIAMVMDRFFLYVFTTACICGTLSIFLYAPSLYDPREHIKQSKDGNTSCVY